MVQGQEKFILELIPKMASLLVSYDAWYRFCYHVLYIQDRVNYWRLFQQDRLSPLMELSQLLQALHALTKLFVRNGIREITPSFFVSRNLCTNLIIFSIAVCNGQCGSNHPHSQLYDLKQASFNITVWEQYQMVIRVRNCVTKIAANIIKKLNFFPFPYYTFCV